MDDQLRNQQRTVRRGALLGIIAMGAIIGGIYYGLGPIPGMAAATERLIFALRCNLFAVLPLVLGIGAVASFRFHSENINPLAAKEQGRIVVYGRFVDNTLQQLAMFVLASLVLATFVEPGSMGIIVALTVNFVVGRAAFLVGYLRNPLYRAPGLAMTMYPTVCVLFYDCYRAAAAALHGR